MMKFWRIPTRDANDADHMSLMLFVGGVLSFFQLNSTDPANTVWWALGVISIITAPLLWLRLPHAKWGGVVAAVLFGSVPLMRMAESPIGLRGGWTIFAGLVIAYWFYKIDYDHKFDA